MKPPVTRDGKVIGMAVIDKDGTVLGHVTYRTTSVGASKVAGGPVRYEWVNGKGYCWVKYEGH